MALILSILIGLVVIVLFLFAKLSSKIKNNITGISERNILLVTAHPDDECMFFAPTILNLLRIGKDVFILCLTTGDFYKLNGVRKRELLASCHILGIPESHVHICDHSDIKDGPKAWDNTLVAKIIHQVADEFNCRTLVTFDDYGVSGHTNHIGAYQGVRHLVTTANGFSAFYLKSVGVIEKYCSILLSLPRCLYSGHVMTVSPLLDVWKAQKAMFAHRSQLVWFRLLYIVFSRYMMMNTLEEHVTVQAKRELVVAINADDFGYSEIRNQGIVECYEGGGITYATLMVNGVAAQHAASLAQQYNMPIGLHLNITEGDPVCVANLNTPFVNKDGKMLGKFGLRKAILDGTVPPSTIQNEIEAQMERFRDLMGHFPKHVDGHHHIHVAPVVRELFATTLQSHNVQSTRLPVDIDYVNQTWADEVMEKFMSDLFEDSVECRDIFRKHGLRFTDTFLGTTVMGSDMSMKKIKQIMWQITIAENINTDCSRSALCEFMVHPGYPSPQVNSGCGSGPDEFSMSHDRKHEMDLLLSEDMKMFFKDNNITLKSFPQMFE